MLESGNKEAIAQARKNYWRIYKALWRNQKRKMEKEIAVSWAENDLKTIGIAAKHHKMSLTAYTKAATLAYTHKAYIIPNSSEVRRIAQLLALNYNAVLELAEEDNISLKDVKMILEKITELERTVLVTLHNPKTIDQMIVETVQKKPLLKQHLKNLLELFP